MTGHTCKRMSRHLMAEPAKLIATATDKAVRTGMPMRKSTAMRMNAAISIVTDRNYGKRVVSTNMVEATEGTCILFDWHRHCHVAQPQ